MNHTKKLQIAVFDESFTHTHFSTNNIFTRKREGPWHPPRSQALHDINIFDYYCYATSLYFI